MSKNGFMKTLTKIEDWFDKPKHMKVLILFALAFYLLGFIVYESAVQWQMGTEVIALPAIIALVAAVFLDQKIGSLVYGGGLALLAAAHVASVFSPGVQWANEPVGSVLIIAVASILALLLLASALYYFLKGKLIGSLPKMIISVVACLLMVVTLIVRLGALFEGHDTWDSDSIQHAGTVLITFGAAAMVFVWLSTAFYVPFRKKDPEAVEEAAPVEPETAREQG